MPWLIIRNDTSYVVRISISIRFPEVMNKIELKATLSMQRKHFFNDGYYDAGQRASLDMENKKRH